ncbi:hypothetical protein J437_LFUL017733 [Ladona fulva]|uniref:Uncharacterized protein n=1 Tax=Ladona fulva TaxID=123851 RepID=A0A8K0JWD6_LADFU|nr:hypothetical protein J437_LFUL017733 [Ladona fulva]
MGSLRVEAKMREIHLVAGPAGGTPVPGSGGGRPEDAGRGGLLSAQTYGTTIRAGPVLGGNNRTISGGVGRRLQRPDQQGHLRRPRLPEGHWRPRTIGGLSGAHLPHVHLPQHLGPGGGRRPEPGDPAREAGGPQTLPPRPDSMTRGCGGWTGLRRTGTPPSTRRSSGTPTSPSWTLTLPYPRGESTGPPLRGSTTTSGRPWRSGIGSTGDIRGSRPRRPGNFSGRRGTGPNSESGTPGPGISSR